MSQLINIFLSFFFIFPVLSNAAQVRTGGGGAGGGSGNVGIGTTNYVPEYISSTALGPSALVSVSGNVGIGTITPSANLHISGNGAVVLLNDNGSPTVFLNQAVNDTSGALGNNAGSAIWDAQSFSLSSNTTIDGASFNINSVNGSPSGGIEVRIETNSGGLPSGTLANANADATVSSPAIGSNSVTFTNFTLSASTTYWLVLKPVSVQSTNVNWIVGASLNNPYSGGGLAQATNGTWSTSGLGSYDLVFSLSSPYGTPQTNYASGNTVKYSTGWSDLNGGYEFATSSISSATPQAIITSAGNVGIGSLTPGKSLDVNGTVRMTGFAMNVGSSLNNKVLTSDANGNGTWQTAGGGSALWETNSVGIDTFNIVGIGSTNPGQKLDVQGTVRAISFIGDGSQLTGISGSGTVNSANINTVARYAATGTAVSGSGVLFDTNTNVGISTAGPQALLQVGNTALGVTSGNVGVGTYAPSPSNIDATANKILRIGGASLPTMVFSSTNSAQQVELIQDGAGFYTKIGGHATATNNFLAFWTDGTNSHYTGTERMRIDSAGNVGIGIGTNILTPLEVSSAQGSGDHVMAAFLDTNGNGYIDVGQSTTGNNAINFGYDSTNNYAAVKVNGDSATTGIMIHQGGNVGIGTQQPSSLFEVGLQKFNVLSGGNVGIGSISPQATLDLGTSGKIVSHSSTGLGWTVKTGANTACNTTCGTSSCVFGFDTALAGSDVVSCTDTTADTCVCAGP